MTDKRRSSESEPEAGAGREERADEKRPARPGKAAKPEGTAKRRAGRKPAATASPARKTASKESAKKDAPDGPSPEKARKELPAFGFAEDLLAARQGASAASPTASGPTASGPTALAAGDPERIFAFAERLESETREEAKTTVPVRISTWVTFGLAGEIFALPVEPVREVIRVASITRVPHAPDPIRGVTNVRGRVIPVIDLRLRIGVPPVDLDRSSRVIVVRSRGRRLGLLVDAVHQVAHIDLNKVQPPPEDVMTMQSDYVTGVYHLGDQLILMLDVDRALVVQGPASAAPDHRPSDPPGVSGSAAAT